MSEKQDKSGATIIDAEVEALPPKPSFLAKLGRWLLLGLIAVAFCVAAAAGYHFYTTQSAPVALKPATTPLGAPPPVVTLPAPVTPPVQAPAADTAKLQDLERRLAALAASLERLQQLPGAASDADRVAALEEAVKAQAQAQTKAIADAVAEARKSGAEALRLAEAAITGQAQFDQKLADLTRARAADLRQPVALLLAWQSLRDRAARGSGFVAEANAVAPLLGATPPTTVREAFTAVQAFAASGAPTETALAGSFAAVMEAQQKEAVPATAVDAAQNWWQRALNKLSGLVTIRRVGGEAADGGTDKLSIAAGLLERGDLAGAQAALEGLHAGAALTAWRGGAEARLKLDAALERMQSALRDHFAAAP
ncbi:COG4223 family protein [Ferrovibrio sp.]|uniref:COG4223 family protein n=1 Tax=Ferrovibrio sp. TaxID=1917215 RepID=UPI003D2B4A7B